MPKVTIIITSYNCSEFVNRAIQSCLRANNSVSVEVIVVDDCSTDGTWQLLSKSSNDVPFKLLRTRINMGPSAARNLGIKQATGEYIGFLDGDDYLLPDKISKEVALLQRNPDAVGVFCDSKLEKRNGISPITLKQVSIPPAQGEDFLAHLLKTNCIALHAALIKTSAAKKIMFDESLRRAEDYDFWLRLVLAYGPLLYLDEPLVVYRKMHGGLSSQVLKTIDDNITVLNKVDTRSLNELQRSNLTIQKQGLLRTAAHLRLRSFETSGFTYLQQASELGALPRSQHFGLKLSLKNKIVAMIAYNITSIINFVRQVPSFFGPRAKIVREFNR